MSEEYATERPIAKWLKPLTKREIAEIMKFSTIVANKTRTSEFTEIHWSVKNADLITTLSRHVKLSNPKN